jgi:serine O-acetyltransferase
MARIWSIFVGFDAPLNLPRNLILPHPYAVVINSHAIIGSDCVIYQSVTIGSDRYGNVPTIGDRVTIYSGSVIVGKVFIGDDSIIGANSFVNSDVPKNSIYQGNPARLRSRG